MINAVHDSMDDAAVRLGIPATVIKRLKEIDKEHIFDIEMNSGELFKAYRVQHNNDRGPYKGGIRFHKDVSLEEVQTLATLMSLKAAAIGIPMGGGKGGVAVDPSRLSEVELEELSRKYVTHLQPYIGPDVDIPAPDVNTNAKIIDWMVDEYQKITNDTSKSSFTGKSIPNGGSLGRNAATGRGGVLATAKLLKLVGIGEEPITFAIQGYGNVGSFFGTTGQELYPKWNIIAASDSEGAVYNKKGLDAKQLQDYKIDHKRFKNFRAEGVKIISNEALLSLDVDILVLAGFENTVTSRNMKNIKANIIIELANGPISGEAYEFLSATGKTVLPDIIANAGGVVVSYLEWLQNRNQEVWTEYEVFSRLAVYMESATNEIYTNSKTQGLSLKEAAFDIAIKRLANS